jgi:glycine cleavage system H protein
MDAFTYNNIFDTKGIEYLAIISFFLLLIPFWLVLNRQARSRREGKKLLGQLTANTLRIPQGIFFSRFHTWTHLEKSGVAKVGLDDLLLHITGEVKIKNQKQPGENVRKGDLLAELEHKGKLLKIYSPISGEIVAANPLLSDQPEILNEDPYNKGWMYKLKPMSWIPDTNSYYLAEDANSWAISELERFKDFVATSVSKYSPMPANVILQDGGELIDQPLAELPEEVWEDFQDDFLNEKTLCRNKNCFRKQDS